MHSEAWVGRQAWVRKDIECTREYDCAQVCEKMYRRFVYEIVFRVRVCVVPSLAAVPCPATPATSPPLVSLVSLCARIRARARILNELLNEI